MRGRRIAGEGNGNGKWSRLLYVHCKTHDMWATSPPISGIDMIGGSPRSSCVSSTAILRGSGEPRSSFCRTERSSIIGFFSVQLGSLIHQQRHLTKKQPRARENCRDERPLSDGSSSENPALHVRLLHSSLSANEVSKDLVIYPAVSSTTEHSVGRYIDVVTMFLFIQLKRAACVAMMRCP